MPYYLYDGRLRCDATRQVNLSLVLCGQELGHDGPHRRGRTVWWDEGFDRLAQDAEDYLGSAEYDEHDD